MPEFSGPLKNKLPLAPAFSQRMKAKDHHQENDQNDANETHLGKHAKVITKGRQCLCPSLFHNEVEKVIRGL